MSCDGNCSASETMMFMRESFLDGYDEGFHDANELLNAAQAYIESYDSICRSDTEETFNALKEALLEAKANQPAKS